jgi:hypothetical protein
MKSAIFPPFSQNTPLVYESVPCIHHSIAILAEAVVERRNGVPAQQKLGVGIPQRANEIRI